MEGQRVECFENFIYEKQTFESLGTKKQTSVKVLGWKWYFILTQVFGVTYKIFQV